MKLFKKIISGFTAFSMLASVSAASGLNSSLFSSSVSAAVTYDYAFSLSKKTYELSELKTFSDYELYDSEKHANVTDYSNLYRADVPSKKITEEYMDNKVVEVGLNIDTNSGIAGLQVILDYDESLVFAGCTFDSAGNLSPDKNARNKLFSVSAKYDKVLFHNDTLGDDYMGTGPFATLLFILPDNFELERGYTIGFSERTANQISPTNVFSEIQFSGDPGFIMITDKNASSAPTEAPVNPTTAPATTAPTAEPTQTPATTAPTAEPTQAPATTAPTAEPTQAPATTAPTVEPTPVLTTPPEDDPILSEPDDSVSIDMIIGSDKVKNEQFEKDRIKLDNNAVIDIEVPEKMVFQGTDKVEYAVKLSDFDAKTEYFEYAGFGLELPEGFTVDKDSLKSSLKCNIEYYAPDSLEAMLISKKAGYEANGGFVVFKGVDTSSLSKDAELFTVSLNVPETAKDYVYDIGVAAVYGRLSSSSYVDEDGSIIPYISFIDNGTGDIKYNKTASKLLMGLRGDVNLDHKVSQTDATLILKEALSLSVKGESILEKSINTKEAGDSAVAFSNFLGNVDGSGGAEFAQLDATFLLRALLSADVAGKPVTEEVWNNILPKK